MNYQEFLAQKSQIDSNAGFNPVYMPDFLFDFQKNLLEWAISKGRSAIIADCGLGKTPMLLAWCQNIIEHENKDVLIVTPLAVSYQTINEGKKFNIKCTLSKDGTIHKGITVTNYERLHYFNPDNFGGVVCDESSAIKVFDGKRRKEVTRFLSKIKYRLLCTATAAPNDFIELGTGAEALGVMPQSEMLSTFFVASDNARHSLFKGGDFWNRNKWFFKAHSEKPFWQWVCSWARAVRKPSDLGFADDKFVLPELKIRQHIVKCNRLLDGELFPIIATTLNEQRAERRATIKERCEAVANLVNHNEPVVVWCQYNDEGDYLAKIIPDAVQVAGKNTDDEKEERIIGFTRGDFRVLITKPKIGAWGMNWQHCGHHTFFPSHSYEQYYQAIRRSWRFGRIHPVKVDIVTTEGEKGVTANLQKKQDKADMMFSSLVKEMNNHYALKSIDNHLTNMEVAVW